MWFWWTSVTRGSHFKHCLAFFLIYNACMSVSVCVRVCVREKDGERKSGCFGNCCFPYLVISYTICTQFVFTVYVLAISAFLHYSDTLRAGLACRPWIMWIWSCTLVYRDCELPKDLGSYLTPGAERRQAQRECNTILCPTQSSFSYLVLDLVCLSFSFAVFSFQIFLSLLICNTGATELKGIRLHSLCCCVPLQDNH